MKTAIPLFTLLSAGLVAAAPTPFVKPGPVVTSDTEGVVIPNTNFARREALVADFSKRALEIRGAFLQARGGKNAQNDAANEDGQANADDQANDMNGANENAAKGKKNNNKDNQAAADANSTYPYPLRSESQSAKNANSCQQQLVPIPFMRSFADLFL
jgi:hypothetical protein